jgi:hypothetical protein
MNSRSYPRAWVTITAPSLSVLGPLRGAKYTKTTPRACLKIQNSQKSEQKSEGADESRKIRSEGACRSR